jgi:lipid-binding SYLF domain-containing protein
MRKSLLIAATALGLGAFSALPALAANDAQSVANAPASSGSGSSSANADQLVHGATQAIQNLESDQAYASLLSQAKGVFIIPHEVSGAVGIGGKGGQGVLLKRTQAGWSEPAFMNIESVSVGPQAGGSGGETVMLLMTNKAINQFDQNNFSFGASAGLSVAGYNANQQTLNRNADVIVWAHGSGAYVGANVNATRIGSNKQEDQAFYGKPVSTQQILAGNVQRETAASPLETALPS